MKMILNKEKLQTNIKKASRGLRISKYALMSVMLALSAFTTPVLADDPLAAINNLSTFIFSAIKAIGMILLGFGVVQIGLALKSHDAGQRANGFLTFFGGILIAFSKEILDMIMA